jgi:hypothetical protein
VRRALRVVPALLLVVSGCSLPLPSGVKSVAGVQAGQQQRGQLLQVIPPGPKAGQTPEEAVHGFLGAQANAEDRHAIARSFLTSAQSTAWDDQAEVQVYDLNSQAVTVVAAASDASDEATVRVTAKVTGQIGPDGAYTARDQRVVETYRLQLAGREWRLSEVPPGLRLTAADRERSFRPANVFYPALNPSDTPPHLVPDRVFLPIGVDQATQLVSRTLDPPSSRLRGSVVYRAGLRASRVSTTGSGVVTVDLDTAATALPPAARQDLSAQLVWTLRDLGPAFTGLRLLAAGKAFAVPGQGALQGDGAWDSYDPEGLGPNPPYYFVASRRLRSSAQLPSNPATAGDAGERQAIGVDAVAVTPDRTQIALLDGTAPGTVTVRLGPLRGPTYRTAVTARDLRSPTWGSGDRGLWLLKGGREIVLLPSAGSRLLTVPIVGARPPGGLTSLAASRDGARVALVAGQRLYVGRVEVVAGQVRVADLTPLGAGVTATAVAWVSGTELALVDRSSSGQVQVQRLAVDGSAVETLNTARLAPTQISACFLGLLLTSGDLVYALSGRSPVRLTAGSAPAYPG